MQKEDKMLFPFSEEAAAWMVASIRKGGREGKEAPCAKA
jgi:hypothetical protein